MFISIIPQAHCRVIERFGKPVKTQGSGLAFRIPILEVVKRVPAKWGNSANTGGYLIQLTEQILDTKPRSCITKDNAKVTVNCIIRWRIVDPQKALYEVEDLFVSLINAVLNILRSEIGSMDLDNVLSARQSLTERIIANLATTSSRWGVQIITLEIQELSTDEDTSKAMLQQMEAERESRAISSKAEGSAQATIKTAEAEKSYLEKLTEVITKEEAAKILLATKVVDGYNTISSNPANKVFLPSDIQGIIASDK